MASVDKALQMLRSMPRVALNNIRDEFRMRSRNRNRKPRGQHGGNKCGRGDKGQGQRNTLPRLGFEGGQSPFYLIIPKEPYYAGHHLRRQYPPLSLLQLQRMIDTHRVDPSQPIDLTQLCNSQLYTMCIEKRHYGVHLTDEGADIFQAKINVEVQWAAEPVIAAVERNGGTITTRYYDPACLRALIDPVKFFRSGKPIPRCKLPPQDAVEFYTDARNRGYLADPNEIAAARLATAQKFGYELPDLTEDSAFEMLVKRKDPRQIWFGLEPGWIVNLVNESVLVPDDEFYQEYYKS